MDVVLCDVDLREIDTWTGYMVPEWIGGLPNVNAACPYKLNIDGGRLIWIVPPGDLYERVWESLIACEGWLK